MQPNWERDIQNSFSRMYAIEPQTRTVSLITGSLFILGFGLLFPSIVLITRKQQAIPDRVGTDLIATFSFAIAIVIFWSLRRWLQETSLQLNTDELVYRTPGLIIQTPWDNIERLNVRYGKAELVLRIPAASYMSFGKRLLKETTSASRNIDRTIPLWIFSLWAPQSQLFQDIVRFQPNLVQETKSSATQKKPF